MLRGLAQWILLLALFLIPPSAFAEATYSLTPDGKFQVLPIAKNHTFPQPRRVIAVSDIHGDLNVLLQILTDRKLIDPNGNWIGGDTHLVLAGDLIDRGRNSRLVMDYVMGLEKEAADAGGAVHSLLGNHEIFLTYGYAAKMNQKDPYYFLDLLENSPDTIDSKVFKKVLTDPHLPYAKWFRERPVVVILGDTLFVHAGVSDWMIDQNAPAYINGTVSAWLEYIHGLRDAPPESTHWVMGIASEEFLTPGPLMDRSLAHGRLAKELELVLKAHGIKRVVIGHTLQLDKKRLHGGRVIPLETGISSYFAAKEGSRVTSLEIIRTPSGSKTKIMEHVRPLENHPIVLKEQGRILARALHERKISAKNMIEHMNFQREEAQEIVSNLPRDEAIGFLKTLEEHMMKGLSASSYKLVHAEIQKLMPAQPSLFGKFCSWLLKH